MRTEPGTWNGWPGGSDPPLRVILSEARRAESKNLGGGSPPVGHPPPRSIRRRYAAPQDDNEGRGLSGARENAEVVEFGHEELSTRLNGADLPLGKQAVELGL